MVRVPTEKRYEEHIERELNSLLDDGLQFHSKVHQRDDSWYDKDLCVVGDEFIEFLKETQKKLTINFKKSMVRILTKTYLRRLNKEIEIKGLIHVLRKGFNDVHGGNIKTLFFQSNSSLNPERRKKYLQNKFLLVRQLHYSPNNNNSIDIVIFINGIPILTIELKNQLTGQTVENSDKQYRFDRNPKGEPLLNFKDVSVTLVLIMIR